MGEKIELRAHSPCCTGAANRSLASDCLYWVLSAFSGPAWATLSLVLTYGTLCPDTAAARLWVSGKKGLPETGQPHRKGRVSEVLFDAAVTSRAAAASNLI